MKPDHFLMPYTKVNSKWNTNLNVIPETLKLLEENIGSKINNIFLDLFAQQSFRKAKITTWGFTKSKSFCTVKKQSTKIKGNLLNGR